MTGLGRTARLLSVPVSAAALGVEGLARRLAGQDAEQVRRDVRARRIARTREVLAGSRGGAMKAGQLLSAIEALLPADPDRSWHQAMTSLQDEATGVPWPQARSVLEADLGPSWRELFAEFDPQPAAAASIGQVHRARWRDGSPAGREVAVKIQYPGVRESILTDLRLLAAGGRVVGLVARGLALPAILAELRSRLLEELDYTREALHQKAFHAIYVTDAEACAEAVVPAVVHATGRVLVQDWLDGEPLAQVATTASQADRDRIGLAYQRFLLSGPARVGLLHTDPHPGNFRRMPDGRLGVLDFGSCLALPGGLPVGFGRLIAALNAGEDVSEGAGDGTAASDERVLSALREYGLLRPGVELEVSTLRDYLSPFGEPARRERFTYSTAWLREQFSQVNDPRNPEFAVGLKLSIPPEQLFTFRVWLGIVGVLSQLGATVPVRSELHRWLPGFE
ncbi:MAG: AarF/ABC1/UbiB kinase family protein [Kineosporiaceae bacterium]|nr:AarF/ABC1/UbiB kinase family protein [Kineosporiaceae bacterium]